MIGLKQPFESALEGRVMMEKDPQVPQPSLPIEEGRVLDAEIKIEQALLRYRLMVGDDMPLVPNSIAEPVRL